MLWNSKYVSCKFINNASKDRIKESGRHVFFLNCAVEQGKLFRKIDIRIKMFYCSVLTICLSNSGIFVSVALLISNFIVFSGGSVFWKIFIRLVKQWRFRTPAWNPMIYYDRFISNIQRKFLLDWLIRLVQYFIYF